MDKIKPITEDRGYKKIYRCPECGQVIGQKNSGMLYSCHIRCCGKLIDWKEIQENTKEKK